MKQWIFEKYGDQRQLKEREATPAKPVSGQVGVRVEALSVNPIDWKLMSGKLRLVAPSKFPAIPCFDVAGVVEDTNGVPGFHKGDKVFTRLNNRSGGAASGYVNEDAAMLAKIPEGLSFAEAAAIPLAALTALQGLRDQGGMRMQNSGQRVLIVGASGGVGHFAVQIAAYAGAHVTAVCGTSNVALVKSLGAHEIIDYRKQADFKSSSGQPYDIVLDCVGQTPFNFEKRFAPVMKHKSIYVTPVPTGQMFLRKLQFWRKPQLRVFFMHTHRADLDLLSRMYSEGKLKVVLDSTYKFSQLPKAFERSMSGRSVGKIVIKTTDETNA